MTDWFFLAPTEEAVEKKAGPGRGWWAPPKGTHGPGSQGRGLPNAAAALNEVMPAINRAALVLSGKGLLGASTKGGRPVRTIVYNPKTGTLLAGAKTHAHVIAKYGSGEPYDDFVKMGLGMEGELRIYVDRHTGRDVADRWNKAFEAAKQMRRVGWPGKTSVQLMYGGGQETGPTSKLEEF